MVPLMAERFGVGCLSIFKSKQAVVAWRWEESYGANSFATRGGQPFRTTFLTGVSKKQ